MTPPDITLVLRGATVYDGTGAPPVLADVAIAGDRIVEVGQSVDGHGAPEVDLTGLCLSPGFIDTHTHDDFAVLLHPDMAFKVCGGVTTCIVGNCGMGAAPHRQATRVAQSFHPDAELPDWDGFRGYFELLESSPPSVNVAALMGHGTIRAAVMGRSDAEPTLDQLEEMQAILTEGLDAGCLGMSTGLIYEPGNHSTTDELVELATTVAEAGGIYTSHLRNEADLHAEAIDEAIEIGRRSGAPVVISHLKRTGRRNWGTAAHAIRQIEAANAEGLSVAADQYPYTAGSTVLSAIVGQGTLRDPDNSFGGVTGDDLVVASCPNAPAWEGRSIASIAEELGMDAADAADHVVATDLRTTIILHSMSEDDVQTILAADGIMIGSDGLPTLEGRPHPRLYGTFARVLGHYSRDLGVLGLAEAVHRMTGRSAEVFGLTDRGVIRPGAIADLVAFDASAIIDVGTFDDPQHVPEGIVGVWVAGRPVVADGVHTGDRPGRVLRRGGVATTETAAETAPAGSA
ncbi:MAG: D-aminoacylase [Acidimicrobiales bacterium]